MDRKSFVFYKDWRDAIKDLPDNFRLEVYDAIVEYGLTGKQPQLKPIASVAFNFIKPQIDRNNTRYINGCKGAEHGKKGGRKPLDKPLKNPTKTPNDNVNDNDIYKKEINKEKDFEVELDGVKKIILSSLYPFMQEMQKDQVYLDRIGMNEHIPPDKLNHFLIEFFVLRSNENNQEIQTLNDAQRYFGNWIRLVDKQKKFKTEKSHVNPANNLHPALQ